MAKINKLHDNQADQSTEVNPVLLSINSRRQISEMGFEFDDVEQAIINQAVCKAEENKGDNCLILSDRAAYIVSVAKHRVEKVLGYDTLLQGVSVPIDSAVVVHSEDYFNKE